MEFRGTLKHIALLVAAMLRMCWCPKKRYSGRGGERERERERMGKRKEKERKTKLVKKREEGIPNVQK
jgi:hypothetical protein